jgi:hypothetical protein
MTPLLPLLLPLAMPAQGGLEHLDFLPSMQDEQRFGASFTELGDVNGDGISDFAIGSPGYVSPAWSWGGGLVEVFSGADRSRLYGVGPVPGVDSLLGQNLITLGDINQDGANEFLVGAGGFTPAYVISGIDGTRLGSIVTNSNGQVGMQATTIGDLDGDGLPEFALGLPNETVFGLTLAGKVMVFDGANWQLRQEIHGQTSNRWLGNLLCGPGDLDGNGTPDLLIGGNDQAILLGEGFTALRGEDLQPIYRLDRRTVRMDIWDLDPAGDFNGDGQVDILATGYQNNENETWIRGVTRVLSGVDGTELFEVIGDEFEDFGRKSSLLGDVDGDGTPDFAVLSLPLNRSWASAPKVRVFSGADGDELANVQSPRFGFFIALVAGVSDLDGDGRAEIVLAVSDNQVGGGTPGFLPGGEVHLAGYKD